MLNGCLTLYDVHDVEAFCGRLLDDHLNRTRGFLNPTERADCLSHLIGGVWELSRKWDPSHGVAFSTYGWRLGKFKIVDWYRVRYGRSRYGGDAQRNINFPHSLDAAADGSPDGAPLGATLPGEPGDFAPDSLAARLRALGGGSRVTAEDTAILRALAA